MSKIVQPPHAVVVWDPEGEYWPGGVVTQQQAREFASKARRGVVTLPVLVDQLGASGCGGYSKREWGAGVPLSNPVPRLLAPLVLYVDALPPFAGGKPAARGIAWAARLVRDAAVKIERPDGTVRFAADGSQRNPQKATYHELGDRQQLVRELGAEDRHGGWTVGGEGSLGVAAEGHYGFALYATAPGLRVVWVAASLVQMYAD